MIDKLKKYRQAGQFIFQKTDRLSEVCNAPTNKSGVYIVYALHKGMQELIYIGRSGKLNEDGSMFIRKAKLGGIKDRIVNGLQAFDGKRSARKRAWPEQMQKQGIERLQVYWFVTHSDSYSDCPSSVEQGLLEDYFTKYGKLPKWNKKI